MRRICLVISCLFGLVALGCASKGEPGTSRDEWNRDRFASTPAAVAEGFARDYPEATVANVIVYRASSLRPVYRVDFIRAGDTDIATYLATGQRVSPPVPPIISN